MPQVFVDRSTGRKAYRYHPREMSGSLPPILYKYLPFEYAQAMIERGELMFSTLAWFQNYEDCERGDEFEGTHKYFPIGGLQVTRTERDGRPHPPISLTLPNDSLQSKATGRNHIFIYSTSKEQGLTQFGDPRVQNACVEICDPATFLAQLRGVLRRNPRAKFETLIHDEVRYYSLEDPPDNIHALPDRLTMHKHKSYEDQREYRFAFGTRRDVFDFEHIDYHIVREGIRHPRDVLDENKHRRLLKIGSLAHCCRLL